MSVDLRSSARRIRRAIVETACGCGAPAHLGASLSMVEILSTLYGEILRMGTGPCDPCRDRFVLSKGHAALGLYATLFEFGHISAEKLATFQADGTELVAHPVRNPALRIESSNGSLGQGLSFCIGLAIAARRRVSPSRAYVLMGDGECDEGSVWEGAMLAAHLGLDNLVAIIDANGMQSDGATRDILDPIDMRRKWECFGWSALQVDGHDVDALREALHAEHAGKPLAIVACTTKGKGVSFMENDNSWHHARLTGDQLDRAIAELGGVP